MKSTKLVQYFVSPPTDEEKRAYALDELGKLWQQQKDGEWEIIADTAYVAVDAWMHEPQESLTINQLTALMTRRGVTIV